MLTLSETTTATYCLMATYSTSSTAPLSIPEPLPLIERLRWSVSGGTRKFAWAAAAQR